MTRVVRLGGAIVLALACGGARGDIEPERTDPRGPPRYGPECDALIARARADSAVRTMAGFVPARPWRVLLPPAPAPATVRGRPIVLEIWVDSVGTVDIDRSAVHGVSDASYVGRLRALLREVRYWPARLDGCAVPSVERLQFTVF